MDDKNLETCSRDEISSLPDEVLGKILSLLPTEQAASTSVLSKKWRNVFRLVDNLDFDDSVSVHAGEYKEARWYVSEEDKLESFKSFVDRTLALQGDYLIKKFSLKCHVDTENNCQKVCVSRWICNVLERGVLELDLRIKTRGKLLFPPPPELFASKTLVKLTLGTRLNLGKLSSGVSLPSLKTLFIDTVSFTSDDLCGVLLAGCPVLEELSVHHNGQISPKPPETLSSPTVKRLSVKYSYSCSSMTFDLPKLVYFDYTHFGLIKFHQVNLESLVEAKLDLHLLFWLLDVTDLIVSIRNVEILHLSPALVDVMYSYCRNELPVLNNLVSLYFGSQGTHCWRLLPYLLKQSPKLETLIIQDLNYYTEVVSMPLNQVKVLHILSYRGTTEELKQLKNFLGEFECLEVVQVDVNEEDDGITERTKRRLMLLGVSLPSKCKITLI